MERQRKFKKPYILFGIYCILLIWFKLSFSITQIEMMLGARSINFIPFYYENETRFHYKEVLMNVIIFIPFGLYLKMIDIDSKKAIIYGLLFSFVMECCQFIFKLGASDITDILTNIFGTIIGVVLYSLFIKIFKNREKVDNVISFFAFVATIAFGILFTLLVIAN